MSTRYGFSISRFEDPSGSVLGNVRVYSEEAMTKGLIIESNRPNQSVFCNFNHAQKKPDSDEYGKPNFTWRNGFGNVVGDAVMRAWDLGVNRFDLVKKNGSWAYDVESINKKQESSISNADDFVTAAGNVPSAAKEEDDVEEDEAA
jgi:hypothetical protein